MFTNAKAIHLEYQKKTEKMGNEKKQGTSAEKRRKIKSNLLGLSLISSNVRKLRAPPPQFSKCFFFDFF